MSNNWLNNLTSSLSEIKIDALDFSGGYRMPTMSPRFRRPITTMRRGLYNAMPKNFNPRKNFGSSIPMWMIILVVVLVICCICCCCSSTGVTFMYWDKFKSMIGLGESFDPNMDNIDSLNEDDYEYQIW